MLLEALIFCESHRHNAEMTAAMHFEQCLHRGSWDAILSNVFVKYVYNVLTLQYQTISRQVSHGTYLDVSVMRFYQMSS